jgi:uncharacterized protein (DUF433 family)
MNWKDRIVIDPNVLVGKPVIRGTRIAVEFIVELLAEGWTHEQILKNYPHLTTEDIQTALHYASVRSQRTGGYKTKSVAENRRNRL